MTAAKSLRDYQLAQRNHDIAFHRDVFYRSSSDRLRHYCLHFAKYVGRLARAPPEGEELAKVLKATVVDATIICLALSDVLNVDLDEQLEGAFGKPAKPGAGGWASIIDVSRSEMGIEKLREFALHRGGEATGDLCKVAESLDHIEALDPRTALTEGLIAWLSLVIVCSQHLKIDLFGEVEARWREIEKKRVT